MGLIEKPIALAPAVGGCSIGDNALQPADIIVSTTKAALSGAIRVGTASTVSHAALYAGSGSMIEAIGPGVITRSIYDSLEDDALAVAYRCPHLTASVTKAIIAFASKQVALKASYTALGAFLSTDDVLCRIVGPRPAAFFCSQLVIEAFKQGGMPLTTQPAQCVTPQGITEIAIQKLVYVGHLKGNSSWLPIFSP